MCAMTPRRACCIPRVTRVFSQNGYTACPFEIKLDGTNMDILTPQGLHGFQGLGCVGEASQVSAVQLKASCKL